MNIMEKFGIKTKSKRKHFKKCPDCGVLKGQAHKKNCDLGTMNKYPKKFPGYLD